MKTSRRVMHTLFLLLVVIVACAGAPRPVPLETVQFTATHDAIFGRMMLFGGIGYSSRALRQADSAYSWGLKHRTEPAMCVASGGFTFGMAANGHPYAFILSFATSGPQAARIRAADSLHAWWAETICGDSLPSWHGHVVENEIRRRPSDCDLHMAAVRPLVPFHIVQGELRKAWLYLPSQTVMLQYESDSVDWCGDASPPDDEAPQQFASAP